jgi:hypothetical protein
VIIQIVIIDPDICEYRPCKRPACTCPQNYRLPLAEQKIRDSVPLRWLYIKGENPA